jgi:hypothetical protein
MGETMRIARYYQKTLFGILALMGIILVATSVIYVRTVDRQLTDYFLNSSRAIARAIANSDGDLVVNQNYPALQSVIDQYLEIPGVSYVFVVDGEGTIIAHTFVPGVPDEIMADYKGAKDIYERKLAGLGSFSEVTAAIISGAGGRVHVGMDKGYFALQVQTAIGSEVYLLTIIFILSVLVSFALMYHVSRPLLLLGSYAWHCLSGEQHSAPSPPQLKRLLERVDEVGELGRLIRRASGGEA